MINFYELQDDFQRHLHSIKNLNISYEQVNEPIDNDSINCSNLKHKYTIDWNINNNCFQSIYKCSDNSKDIFNRYGRFNNNIYSNSFFKNNELIQKNIVSNLYDVPKQFNDFFSFINETLDYLDNIETFNNNIINEDINDDFFILKKGKYNINNKYHLDIKEDLFFYIHIDIIKEGKCYKYNIACPQLIGHEFFNYNNPLYIHNDINNSNIRQLTINNVLNNLFDVIRLLESLKRRKYEDYVLYLNFDDNDDENFKIDFINTYIKKIFNTFKISLIKN